MDRRDALDPRHFAALVDPPTPSGDPDAVLLRFSRQAMATNFEVALPLGTPHDWPLAALDEIDRLERQMTVYRDDSEVSLINRLASERPIAVENNLYDLFLRCQTWHRETRGAFDIAAGALIKCWGFYRRAGRVPSVEERREALGRSGMGKVKLHEGTIAFDRPGVEINLGAVGKGYAVDRATLVLRHAGVVSGLVHGGHSSVFAMGPSLDSAAGWSIALAHPDDAKRSLGQFRLSDRGLGISAASYQSFEHAGRKLGHILDPRSAWPAEGVATVAVTAPTAAQADALATAFFIVGVDAAREICETRPELGAVIQTRGAEPILHVLGAARREFVAAGS